MAIGYRITDIHCDPPGLTEQYHSERLLRLPSCAWLYEPDNCNLLVAPPPVLATGQVTFGCLNKPVKITQQTMETWSPILAPRPNSRLVVRPDPRATTACAKMACAGIDPSRLELVRTGSRHQYLDAYNRVDIALDTFPYNGDTTTCDALWMGVPVVSLGGDRFVSRRGVSHLRNINLDDLIGPR